MKTLTAEKTFHNTEATFTPCEIYESDFGPVSLVTESEWVRIQHDLCGIKDCMCSAVSVAKDNDGKRYSIQIKN